MPSFTERAECRAPAREVWKLLYDPHRYTEWWEGTERVEVRDGAATRYVDLFPGTAFPTGVASGGAGERVTISCIDTDIVYEWTLESTGSGCSVRVQVEIPERHADKVSWQEEGMRASMARLVALAEGPMERVPA